MRNRDVRSVSNCKRGQWLQLTFGIVLILVLGIVFLVLSKFGSDINDEIQGETDISSEAKVVSSAHTNATGNVFDSSMAFVLVGIWLLCLGLAYNSGGSPMLLIIALVVIVALGFAGMIFSNTWDEVAGDGDFSNARSELPMTGLFLDNYLIVVLVMGFSTVMVGLSRGGGF